MDWLHTERTASLTCTSAAAAVAPVLASRAFCCSMYACCCQHHQSPKHPLRDAQQQPSAVILDKLGLQQVCLRLSVSGELQLDAQRQMVNLCCSVYVVGSYLLLHCIALHCSTHPWYAWKHGSLSVCCWLLCWHPAAPLLLLLLDDAAKSSKQKMQGPDAAQRQQQIGQGVLSLL